MAEVSLQVYLPPRSQWLLIQESPAILVLLTFKKEEEDGSPTPRKPKKRSRAKKEEDNLDVEEPLAKKTKATQKRSKKKLKEEYDEDADSVAAPVPLKKDGGRGKKNDTKVKVEDEGLKNESGEEGATANVSQGVASKREATESDQDSETVLRASQLIPKGLQKPTDEAANGKKPAFEGKKGKKRAKATQVRSQSKLS